MRDQLQGRPFTGVFSSADASALNEANSRFTLYTVGSSTALVLAANERVVITDLAVVVGSALAVTVYDGADAIVDAGEVILKGSFGTNGGISQNLQVPHYGSACQSYPKVKTGGAGQVDAVIRGVIVREGF